MLFPETPVLCIKPSERFRILMEQYIDIEDEHYDSDA